VLHDRGGTGWGVLRWERFGQPVASWGTLGCHPQRRELRDRLCGCAPIHGIEVFSGVRGFPKSPTSFCGSATTLEGGTRGFVLVTLEWEGQPVASWGMLGCHPQRRELRDRLCGCDPIHGIEIFSGVRGFPKSPTSFCGSATTLEDGTRGFVLVTLGWESQPVASWGMLGCHPQRRELRDRLCGCAPTHGIIIFSGGGFPKSPIAPEKTVAP